MSETNGTRLIDRIAIITPEERRKLTVPEWGVDIYFRPITKSALDAAMPTDGVERPLSTQGLFLLVHTAEYEDGSKVFQRADIERLRTKVPLDVLTRVEAFMWGTQVPEIKEAEKIIESDPTSASA